MDYVIDFTGYYIATGKFILKEYCLVPILADNVKNHESYVVKPPCSFSKLSDYYQKAYSEIFYSKYGINWIDGEVSEKEARESIISKLTSADIIYLKHANKMAVLLELTGKLINPKKIVGLDDYGLDFSVKASTSLCLHHDDPSKNWCVVRNALICAYWVSESLSPESYKSVVESWSNKTAEELMKIGCSNKISQDGRFENSDDSDDSGSDETVRRINITLNPIKKKPESTDDNKGLDSSNMDVDNPGFVDFDRDSLESQSKDVNFKFEKNLSSIDGRVDDFDGKTEDSLTLAQMQRLLKSDHRNRESYRKPVVKLKRLSDNEIRKLSRPRIRKSSRIGHQIIKKGADVERENTLGRNLKLGDEKLEIKRATVKLNKLDDSIFRKRYKFGKRIYLSELKL